MTATLLKTDGSQEVVEPANGREWTLAELQGFVGGYIEIVHCLPEGTRLPPSIEELGATGMILVVNEEGLLERLPINAEATRLYGAGIIVGPALYCPEGQVS